MSAATAFFDFPMAIRQVARQQGRYLLFAWWTGEQACKALPVPTIPWPILCSDWCKAGLCYTLVSHLMGNQCHLSPYPKVFGRSPRTYSSITDLQAPLADCPVLVNLVFVSFRSK